MYRDIICPAIDISARVKGSSASLTKGGTLNDRRMSAMRSALFIYFFFSRGSSFMKNESLGLLRLIGRL